MVEKDVEIQKVYFFCIIFARVHNLYAVHSKLLFTSNRIPMKVYSAIVKLVLRKNKVLANGLHPIMLRVCFGSQREKSTGYCCDIAHWDKKNEMVKPGFENAEVINKIISEFKMKIINRKLQFEMVGKKYTPEMLLDDSRQDFNARSNVFREVMKDLLAGKQVRKGTKAHYLYAFKQLAEFMGTEDFLVNDLTENKMAAFIYSTLQKVSEGTLYTSCSKIASVCNFAIDNGLLPAEDYCFRRMRYSKMVRKSNKTAYIDKANLVRIEQYYLNLVTEGDDDNWSFKQGAVERIRKRTTEEFALCFWIAMLKLNGSAPIDVALLKKDNFCVRNYADKNGRNNSYYCFDFKRAKTGTPVRPRILCDRLARAVFEPFVGTTDLREGYIFPVIQNDRGTLKTERTYESMKYAVQHIENTTLKKMKEVCRTINEEVAKANSENKQCLPLIDIDNLSCYNIRHSFAMAYLSSPGANVNALASLLARSPNSIGTYITQLSNDHQIIESVAQIGI